MTAAVVAAAAAVFIMLLALDQARRRRPARRPAAIDAIPVAFRGHVVPDVRASLNLLDGRNGPPRSPRGGRQ